MIIKRGSYSCQVLEYDAPPWQWVTMGFVMSGVHGLDIENRTYKHKSSAVRYAKQQLAIKVKQNEDRIKL